ncbi:hypothetical protein EJ08DRAFT_645309 [Tothia fuscella]|uniref:Exosome complex protein n=1 Tax=Tothia fuscella TaxID=1048955 RepID=A0A9P4P1M9_9PEZI|nr:hypothetical protein EJ08DRAFT_645309 [Tothia fuscella]
MDTEEVHSLIEDLDTSIDKLEDALKPLLDVSIASTAASLPVLERAKLYVLVTYAIESVLFSHVRLSGADAKEHPIIKELARVRQYFEKIEKAENPVGKRENLSLNKPAAGRIIKAALSGNIKFDKEQERKKMREMDGARVKLEQLDKKRKAEAEADDDVEDKDSSSSGNHEAATDQKSSEKGSKKKRKRAKGEQHEQGSSPTTSPIKKSKKSKKSKSHGKKSKKSKESD